jgi:hypothetical protein
MQISATPSGPKRRQPAVSTTTSAKRKCSSLPRQEKGTSAIKTSRQERISTSGDSYKAAGEANKNLQHFSDLQEPSEVKKQAPSSHSNSKRQSSVTDVAEREQHDVPGTTRKEDKDANEVRQSLRSEVQSSLNASELSGKDTAARDASLDDLLDYDDASNNTGTATPKEHRSNARVPTSPKPRKPQARLPAKKKKRQFVTARLILAMRV